MAVTMNSILTVDEIVSMLNLVFRSYGIKKAVLFGAYSKNTASEKSDVDLCVDSGLRGLKFVGFIDAIKSALGGKEVDIIDVTHIDKGSIVEKEIERTGVEIYAESFDSSDLSKKTDWFCYINVEFKTLYS